MAFETGTATSTFDLMDKLTTFMSTVSGWTVRSDIGTYDKVYFSTGTSGRNAIYIRQRVGAVEEFLRGGEQHDYGSGDTGFLNFQAYVHFPEDGDAYAGVSEIGKFGPRMFWTAGNTNQRWWHQDILHQQPGGHPHVAVSSDPVDEEEPSSPNNVTDWPGAQRLRWATMWGYPSTGSSFVTSYRPVVHDGHRYTYFADIPGNSIERYQMARSGGQLNVDGSNDRSIEIKNLGWAPMYIVQFEDFDTRRQYLFVAGGSSSQIVKIRLPDYALTNLASIPWPARSNNTTAGNAHGCCWDGGQFIYVMRGGYYGETIGSSTPDWARYDIKNNTWIATTNPESANFRALPRAPTDYSFQGRVHLDYIDKRTSGFEYNMLYSNFSDYHVLAMRLNDNGMPDVSNSFWTDVGDFSTTSYYRGQIFANRHGKLFHCPEGTNGQINYIHERWPSQPHRAMLHAHFPATSSDIIEWKATSNCYFPEYSNAGSMHEFIDGYACRVRTSVNSDTEYVFIADEDRVIVATKSNSLLDSGLSDNRNEWSVAYMGAFDSGHSSTPYGELEEDVNAGYSRKVKLVNSEGTFEENKKYFIIDTTGESYTVRHEIWNSTNTFAKSESCVVEKVEGDTITISPRHNYKAGSKIAIDPLPTGLFFWELEKFQVSNSSIRLYDDLCGTDDPSAQICTCPIPEGEVDTSVDGAISADAALPLWEYDIVAGIEGEGTHRAREARGKMIGVYALGKGAGIEPGQAVSIGDDAYIVLDLYDYNKYVLIGPLSE